MRSCISATRERQIKTLKSIAGYWFGLTICFAVLSLLKSGFVLVHVVIGFGLLAALGWVAVDRWMPRKTQSRRAAADVEGQLSKEPRPESVPR